jgi:hypothetical protein
MWQEQLFVPYDPAVNAIIWHRADVQTAVKGTYAASDIGITSKYDHIISDKHNGISSIPCCYTLSGESRRLYLDLNTPSSIALISVSVS